MKVEEFERASGSLEERLRAGLMKVALATRHALFLRSARHELSAIQAQVLSILAREGPVEVCALASRLGLAPATVSDSIAALERRGFVRRVQVSGDRRRVRVEATSKGLTTGNRLSVWPELLSDALDGLDESEKRLLFRVITKVILSLLKQGVIREARMCVTCSYFMPFVHRSNTRPHHCGLVDLPLGPETIRLDCVDHRQGRAPAEVADLVGNWMGKEA